MAKYKNWYLAGESGMKDERKKLKLIILQCIAVITANFITIWYFEELFFRGFWYVCKLRSNGMPVPLLRNGYSIFNGTKYR
ncbi:hypothetical protein PMN76_19615, partial [Blautia wexlerae]|uniref:hypothetical protein n=1 Tax=Blautia wexlerae TaxID=418240 RepID=UPI00232EE824